VRLAHSSPSSTTLLFIVRYAIVYAKASAAIIISEEMPSCVLN